MSAPIPLQPELRAACVVAEKLAAQGRHLEALAAWDAALRAALEPESSPELLARAVTGRARALLDLDRPTCALKQLDNLVCQALSSTLTDREAFALHLCRAEVMARLGRVKEMDAAFSDALQAAAALGDVRCCALAWSRLLERAFAAHAWSYLLTEAAAARIFARRTHNAALMVKASVVRANALMALGRQEAAEAELRALLSRGGQEEREALRLMLAG
ncbi:MAG: hypothetical protein H6741_26495 [Alphaproteobacteria bacterium]|nr:hypothetical protein [Alphaproteobacteria bacterium]MCB9796259.1 hypothetical protein [Alphaproteobacteria bacterium]